MLYTGPSIEVLKKYTADQVFTDEQRVRYLGERLQQTINTFKLGATIKSTQVTSIAITFSLEMEDGAHVKNLKQYKADLEMALLSSIELEDNGNGMIDVTLKNMSRPLVGLRSIIETESFLSAESLLTVAVGIERIST